jgi:hypothetical protein
MRRAPLLPYLVILIALLVFFLGSSAFAQAGFGTFGGATINGVPPSVTSFGFGGHPGFHGVPASVTSLNFGNAPVHVHPGRVGNFGFGNHHRGSRFANPLYGSYYMPYAYPVYVMDPGVDDTMEEDAYQGGPTIFDRRGPVREYVEREREPDYRSELNQPREEAQQPAAEPQPVADQPNTVLVFKDGHQQEVGNYAIVGATLYDLTDGRTKKVALAELDVAATVKQNDNRGIDFRIPAGSRTN